MHYRFCVSEEWSQWVKLDKRLERTEKQAPRNASIQTPVVKQGELEGWKTWNLENGLESLVDTLAEKCQSQGVSIKTKSQF